MGIDAGNVFTDKGKIIYSRFSFSNNMTYVIKQVEKQEPVEYIFPHCKHTKGAFISYCVISGYIK